MAGFAERGIKGWAWTVEQYLEVIPELPGLGFTFLANCYASLADIEHQRWGTPGCNRWWEPLPEDKRRGYESVVGAARAAGLDFWFSMNPNLFSERFATVDDRPGLEALWAHYDWMQGLGVRTFNLALDDIGQGVDAISQARLANELLRRLQVADAGARLVLCPTIYWGDGNDAADRPYLAALARALDPAIAVFWTGEGVISPRISARAARGYRAAVGGRRLVIWDNYPVNDAMPTMHLGPLVGRDPTLADLADAYMANPMASQHRLSLLPLATSAEYAIDPAGYDPGAAIARAIDRIARTTEERDLLRSLVAFYPGMLVFGRNQYFNPVRDRFDRGVGDLAAFAALVEWFGETFGGRYPAELATLEADLAFAREAPRS